MLLLLPESNVKRFYNQQQQAANKELYLESLRENIKASSSGEVEDPSCVNFERQLDSGLVRTGCGTT